MPIRSFLPTRPPHLARVGSPAGRADRRSLYTGNERRFYLGRRRLRAGQPNPALASGAWADLVPAGGHAPILSAGPYDLLARIPSVGLEPDRLPRGQCNPARPKCRFGLATANPPKSARRLGCRRPVCPAPSTRRVGGVDYRTQEHTVRHILSGCSMGLSALRRSTQPSLVLDRFAPFCRGPAQQDRHLHPAGRPVAGAVVEGPNANAAHGSSPRALFCPRGGHERDDDVDGETQRRRLGARVGLVAGGARPDRRAGAVVLRGETPRAAQPYIYLPPLGNRRDRSLAVSLSGWSLGRRNPALGPFGSAWGGGR